MQALTLSTVKVFIDNYYLENWTTPLEDIEQAVHTVLSNTSIAAAEKYSLVDKAYTLFQTQEYTFSKEPLLPLLTPSGYLQVPISFIRGSKLLNSTLEEDKESPLTLDLPHGIHEKDYHQCIPFILDSTLPFPDLQTWIRTLAIAHYLDCQQEEIKKRKPVFIEGTPLKHLQIVLELQRNLPAEITDAIVSDYLRNYIASLQTRLNGPSVVEELKTLSDFQQIKLSLNLSSTITSNRDLEAFADFFPHIALLNISHTKVTEIPESLLSRVPILSMQKVHLKDFSVLNNRPTLKELDVGLTPITTAPLACDNLESFWASGALSLKNISSLIGHQKLRSLNLSFTMVEQIPSNCLNLQWISIRDVKTIRSLEALNNLKLLEFIDISETYITQAPQGCSNLISFRAFNTKTLWDISGLDHLKHLREVLTSQSAISRAPIGCENLTSFTASHAPFLTDVAGLNDSQTLKNYTLTKTPVSGWVPLK